MGNIEWEEFAMCGAKGKKLGERCQAIRVEQGGIFEGESVRFCGELKCV